MYNVQPKYKCNRYKYDKHLRNFYWFINEKTQNWSGLRSSLYFKILHCYIFFIFSLTFIFFPHAILSARLLLLWSFIFLYYSGLNVDRGCPNNTINRRDDRFEALGVLVTFRNSRHWSVFLILLLILENLQRLHDLENVWILLKLWYNGNYLR